MTLPHTAMCQRCGIVRQVQPARGIPDLCIDCRLVESDQESAPTLRNGRWVSHRGIRVWQPMRPVNSFCNAPDTIPDDVEAILRILIDAVRTGWIKEQERARRRYCCEDCGCLLLPDEECPGCRAVQGETEAAA